MIYRDAWAAGFEHPGAVSRKGWARYPVAVVLLLAALCAGLVAVRTAPTSHARSLVHYTPPVRRAWQSLDAGWQFHLGDVADAQAPGFDDRTWSRVDTPHTWNAVDGADGN